MQLAICGHGRCGKDTAADWLSANTELCYHGSTSAAAAMLCYSTFCVKYGYTSVEEAFADRHNHRLEWADCIWEYNRPDGLTLYRDMLEQTDILNGVRRASELKALHANKLVDLTIWIQRDVPLDPSCEITHEDCDIVIFNTETKQDLYRRLRRLANILGILHSE